MQVLRTEKELIKLHSVMEIDSLLESLRDNQPLINAFSKSTDAIVEDLIENKTISFVIDKLQLSKDYFKVTVLKKIIEHNLALISTSTNSADCPVIKEIITTYFEIGLMAQDIFLICNAVVQSVVFHLKKEDENIEVDGLLQLFTYNIYNVFTMYSDMMERQKVTIEEKNLIITDNVLFSKTDLKGTIIEVTDAFCDFVGYSRDELIGKTHAILRDPEMDNAIYKGLWKTITSGKERSGELKNIHKDGSKFITNLKIIPVMQEGKIVWYEAYRDDMTSYIDSLTSLLNRRAFEVQFDKLSQKNLQLNMAILDIDDFKLVNDTYGHSVGDDVLVKLSKILYACIRNTDVCARWGGEEFVLLIPDLSITDAKEVIQRIIKSVEKKDFIPNKTITVSAGLAQKKHHEDKKVFFDRVDKRLYKAKQRGKNQVCVD